MTAIEHLLHLHSCEQEGIGSGMPTPQQWIDAVEAARKEYAEHSALKEQEVVVWLCEKEGNKLIIFNRHAVGAYEGDGYTITELIKK